MQVDVVHFRPIKYSLMLIWNLPYVRKEINGVSGIRLVEDRETQQHS